MHPAEETTCGARYQTATDYDTDSLLPRVSKIFSFQSPRALLEEIENGLDLSFKALPYFLNHRLNVNYWSIRDPPPDENNRKLFYRVCFRVSNFRISDMMRVVRKNAKKFLFD